MKKKVSSNEAAQARPNPKNYTRGPSHTLGLIVTNIANPFCSQIARAVEDESTRNKFTVVFGSSDENPDRFRDLIDAFIKQQVAGFILVPTENSETHIEYLHAQNIPFVLLDRYFPTLDTNYVVTNNYEASYEAVQHLIKNNRRKIGMLAYKTSLIHIQERIRGYTAALNDHNLSPKKSNLLREVTFDNTTKEVPQKLAELITDHHIDAIFFATHTLAAEGLKFLLKEKYTIPNDIAIASFDTNEAFGFLNFKFPHIRQPLEKIGKEAVQLLVAQIEGDDSKSRVIINGELIG